MIISQRSRIFARSLGSSTTRKYLWLALLALVLSSVPSTVADQEITYTNAQNELLYLSDSRKPALYTRSFGDCLGAQKSLIDVSRWDAAFYKDNMTISFHIGGTTNLTRESVMIYIAVYAYGENRFELAWNPCGTGVSGLCPVRGDTPILANGLIPLGIEDLNSIPNIALTIPDFEGQAILRIFSNSTKSEIACFTAEVTNGATFKQPAAVGTILGVFTIVAIVSSVATVVYGESISEMRTHYAHSLSLLVVFSVFHHIYFTGALSVNWPSVLVSFWSNYAWAAGMIYTSSMQNSITSFLGKFQGDTMSVGAASAGSDSSNVGGGVSASQIYKRFATPELLERNLAPGQYHNILNKRAPANATGGFRWYGDMVRAGLPLPGNYSGFAGTLSKEGIPAANAFLTGLIWLIICILIMAGAMTVFKFTIEGLYRFKIMKTERIDIFRTRWLRFVTAMILRICYIAFFMMMFLTIFQFTYDGAPGTLAIAAIVFVIMLVGIFGIVGYACYCRMRHGKWFSEPDRLYIERSKSTILPWYHFYRGSKVVDPGKLFTTSIASRHIGRIVGKQEIPVHEDEEFMMKFGWLASRFRESRWWFFALWVVYEFIRACFYGGASGHALVQVFGLLIVEFIAFIVFLKLKPYEGQRLNIIMIWLLGLSKVSTVALSSAFDTAFNLQRIPATVIGIIVIIVQGVLTIALMICIILSAISSYFSITRNRAEMKPKKWMPRREKYFAHIEQAGTETPQQKYVIKSIEEPVIPRDPYFSVIEVKRIAKIEDEDPEFQDDILVDPRIPDIPLVCEDHIFSDHNMSENTLTSNVRRKPSLAVSIRSNASRSSLPYGAVLHRGSWSTRDFLTSQAELDTSSGCARSGPSSPVIGSFPRNVVNDLSSQRSSLQLRSASELTTPNIGTSSSSGACWADQTSDITSGSLVEDTQATLNHNEKLVPRSPSGGQRRFRTSESIGRAQGIDEENMEQSSGGSAMPLSE